MAQNTCLNRCHYKAQTDKLLMQTTISLFESHKHGLQGGLIATSSSGNISNFIRYLAGMVMHEWGAQLQGSNMAILGLK